MENKYLQDNLLKFGNELQLVAVVYAKDQEGAVIFLPKEDLVTGELVPISPSVKDWKELLRQTDLLNVEGIDKAILRKTARQIDQNISWAVYRRDNYTCRYCGNNQVPLTVDHVITWETGGPSIEENLVTSCKKCNRIRGNMPYDEWLLSDAYQQRSEHLSGTIQQWNRTILHTLDDIPRVTNQRSR